MNRIVNAIAKMELHMAERIEKKLVTKEQVEKARKGYDMGVMEYCKFQELKSVASMEGILTLEEATTVYNYLGESVETFNRQNIAVKHVLTEVFAMLLKKRMSA